MLHKLKLVCILVRIIQTILYKIFNEYVWLYQEIFLIKMIKQGRMKEFVRKRWKNLNYPCKVV
ncbi:MAG: hypothetical protein A2381_06320 [Bdellovibrionales bacterium RIFOXYB1_FULL_37_110]|nr:MAG: hypothetical protein A2181_08340 [Bdellovibrionales bacterium RIFOXYA1_FULL_38_20]OFZ50157.1 MAG: hypothetical protein A2417_19170 [Bdellovibrionales bacterium RIFOXYC1_FULL_37_79]OFZ57594.1 MAG: hypothetical protein A2381_06320 [Bdellovibrionales bacterium RIFOXYB1_FULL_37_110]OFZ61361.1 MAG: hypothetical protein A2577_00685 [Bdellovibrionales bacterium RIFOXYD1_FULL_36_51]